MSKILLIGDTHLGLGYPNKLDHYFKVSQEYFEKFLFPILDKLTKDDIIVHLGDLFDNAKLNHVLKQHCNRYIEIVFFSSFGKLISLVALIIFP